LYISADDVDGQIIEKQAEYIRYLEEQKSNLSKQIAELTQKLESHQVQIGSPVVCLKSYKLLIILRE
jgi:hypothetical protein